MARSTLHSDVYPYYLLIATLMQEPAPPGQVRLYSDCSAEARVIATIRRGDKLSVRSAVSGGDKTCYDVVAQIGGSPVRGKVVGEDGLAAVKDFERLRTQQAVQALKPAVPPSQPTLAAMVAPVASSVQLEHVANFTGTDTQNQPFSLDKLRGKVVLLCFWSPSVAAAARELMLVARLYSRFHDKGLDAVALSTSLDMAEIRSAMEDFGIPFPVLPDIKGVAGRERVTPEELPNTFVLNRNHDIVAAGLTKAELEETVTKLMSQPPQP